MSSTSPRQGLSNTLRSTKTRFVAVFAFVILTAVFSASALTANNEQAAAGQSGSFAANIFSFFGFDSNPQPATGDMSVQPQPRETPPAETTGDLDPEEVGGLSPNENRPEVPGACTAPPSGNALWWNFTSAASLTPDIAGAPYSVATSGLALQIAGKKGNGRGFDGATFFKQVNPVTPELTVGGGPGMSAEVWIAPTSIAAGQPIIEWGDAADFGAHFWHSFGAPGALFLNLRDSGGNNHIVFTTGNPVVAGATYQHVAFTYDKATGNVSIYYNGAAQTLNGGAATVVSVGAITPDTTLPFNVGRRPSGGVTFYSGLMDELGVYGRALTGAEIFSINESDTFGKCENTIALASATSTTVETTGQALNVINYTLNRTGETSQPATVWINSSPGTAIDDAGSGCAAGTDFERIPTNSLVSFAANATAANFSVTICNDTVAEPSETFAIAISNPQGANTGASDAPSISANTTTITDDDATVTISAVAGSPASSAGANATLEDGGVINYTFSRGAAANGFDLAVNYTRTGTADDATGTTDFTVVDNTCAVASAYTDATDSGVAVIPSGSSSCILRVAPVGDARIEPNETVTLTLAAGSYVIGAPAAQTGIIQNDDFATVRMAPDLPVDEEGNPTATGVLIFDPERFGVPMGSQLETLNVRFETTGTAGCGTDWTIAVSGANGVTAFTCLNATTGRGVFQFVGTDVDPTDIPVVDLTPDINVEPDETVIMTILAFNALGADLPGTLDNSNTYVVSVPNPADTGTINDDDETITVDATVVGSPISEAGPGGMTYNVNRVFNSAGAGSNLIPAVSDAISVNFSLSALVPTGTEANCTGADFTVSGAGVTYVPATCTGTIAFAANQVLAPVVVTPVNDATPESDETVTMTILPNTSGPAGAYGIGAPGAGGVPSGTATATGTISNDDIHVIVTVAPASVLEDGAPNLIYTFTRIGDSASIITANFSAAGDASSVPVADYVVIGATTFTPGVVGVGTIAFPAGFNTTVGLVNARTFLMTVDPTVDTTPEENEEVQVTVNAGAGYTAPGPNPASGVIVNDDTVVTVTASPISSNEDLGPNMVYTFTRTGNFGVALNVPYTVSGTATTADNDYTGPAPGAQVAVFAAGDSTTTVTVDPTADTTVEPDETVIFTLNTPVALAGYVLGAPSVATGTIVNDDTAVNITLAGSPIFENATAGSVMTYTFTRTGLINGNLTVFFSTTGDAASGTDYVQSSTGSVTFTGANTTATVTVDPTPDSDIENSETVILTVLPGTGYNVGATPAQTGTITSDDVDVQLNGTVTNSPVTENGSNNLIYTIQRVGLSTLQEVTVAFTIGGGANPATCGEDYDVLATAGVTFSNAALCNGTGTAVIAAGAASTTVTVDPRQDVVVETDETVRVTLTSCAGSNLSLNLVNTCDLVPAIFVEGVITNDDTDVNVAVAPPTIVEDAAGVMTYTFTRNTSAALLALPLSVNYNSSGTACGIAVCADTFAQDFAVGLPALPAGSSYNGTNGTGTGATSVIQFAANSTTAVITVDPTADTSIEPDQTVILTVLATPGINPVANQSATGTILDEDSSVQFTSATFTHNPEGSGGGTTTASLTVSRNGPGTATSAAQVDASTIQVGGTATGSNSCAIAGTDYVVVSGRTINWNAGEAGNKPFDITICADNVDESNEILNSALSNFIGTQIGSPIAAVTTIVDDDNAPAFALTGTTSVTEGGQATYTVTRTGNATQLSTTVTWAATGVTATGGTDFSPVTGTVTFAAGTGGTQAFTIGAATDLLFEGPETYGVALTAATNGSTFSGTVTTTITDGNTAPTVAINDVTQVELNSGQSAFIFTITRTGDAQANQTMTFSTQDGVGPATPATAPSDYTAVIGDTVTFTSGQTSRQVAVIVKGDVIFEDDETFRANLTNFNFGSATRATGIGTITNDDTAPVFNLTATVGSPNETVAEGSGVGTTVARFTITKTGLTELTSIVSGSTVNGTAIAPGDFTARLNEALATFAPADTVKTFDVNIVRDTIRENTENFGVNLTNVTNGTFGPNTAGTGTITDDEPNPTFALSAVSASNPEGTTATFRVTMNFPVGLSGTEVPSELNCSSNVIAGSSSTNAQATDFNVSTNTITFAAGSLTGSTRPCDFTTVPDTFFEGSEVFNVALAGSSGPIGTISPASLTATITNNDACSFVAANFSDTEGNAGTKPFTHNVVKTCDTGGFNAIVGYASSDGTAANPVDYTEIIPGNLSFTPATTSLPLVVSVNGDLTVELDETYNVLLTGATVNGVPVPTGACGTVVCAVTSGVGTIVNDDGQAISISGTITNFGGGAAAGVTVVLSGTSSASVVTNASGAYTFPGLLSGGNFLVTPTAPAGTVASPTTRSYTGITSSVANANFVLYQSGAIPRTVNVINSYTNPGSPVTVPITLTAQGDEAALSFTMTYNTAHLTAPAVACGSGSVGCTLVTNTATPGVITVAVEATDGTNPTVYAAGTRVVINVTFGTNVTAAVNTPIAFTSVPTQQRVSDSASNPLPTVWNNGFVVFGQGTESDVAPRPSGGSGVDSTDVIQTRRFVTGLDLVNPNFNEFQRADSAPGGTKGDGNLNASDVIQSRRYSAGLDLTQSAGGPFVANPPAPAPERAVGGKLDSTDAPSSVGTIIRAGNSSGAPGTQVFLDINLDHVVADRVVAMQTSVQFDNTKLAISGISTPGSNPDVTLGANVPGATSLTVNANQVGAGRIGFLADSFPELWAPGTNRQIARLRFTILPGAAPGLTPITLISTPVPQSISNDGGLAVTFTNENGSVLITNPPTAAGVTVGGRILTPAGAGLRGATVSITDGNGVVRTVTTSTFGYYQFEEVEAGNNYVVAVASRRYRFTPRLIQVIDNLTDVDFTGQN